MTDQQKRVDAARTTLLGILPGMKKGLLYGGSYADDIETLLASHVDLQSENTVLKESADEHALFDAETDQAFKDLDHQIAVQAEEIERLNERLENNHMFDVHGGRIAVPPGSIPDGIECRDDTIRLQGNRISALTEEVERLRETLRRIEAATPRNTNSGSAADMASWAQAVARTALEGER
ncbi:hypothetical protein PMI01_00949 [Caulobacter sp. AP07]|uniref:hypothetical protein n=1 Tax=Caulobacter sp. AP07 TaxID=1144304 RepID=UPI0002721AD2|nr:hypothetical protein [Caulobacter sp. AP07]EJL36574.1 hypothetical protein PMI01_00949 [Caulobacter sp. AP07]